MDPITIAKLWLLIKPIKRLRNRRRAKKGLPPLDEETLMAGERVTVTLPDGSTAERVEPTIPARTSTKVAVGTGAVAAFPAVELLSWIQSLTLEPAWLETATNSDYFVYYGALAIAYVIARYSKSPVAPGKI